MKKKLIALIAFFVVIVCMCTGCNRTVKEKDIKADLESYTQSSIVEDGQKIDKVEIEKRNTDKKQKYDQIWCAVTVYDLSNCPIPDYPNCLETAQSCVHNSSF